jgi:hypothetical protein
LVRISNSHVRPDQGFPRADWPLFERCIPLIPARPHRRCAGDHSVVFYNDAVVMRPRPSFMLLVAVTSDAFAFAGDRVPACVCRGSRLRTAQEHAPAPSPDEMHEMPMDMDTALNAWHAAPRRRHARPCDVDGVAHRCAWPVSDDA